MPKLTRYLQKIFANNSNEVGVFGTGVDKETSKNVETLQSADYENGWSSAIITNKNYPIWQEMDGVQYGLSYQIKYLQQAGIPEWLSTETYYTNSYCRVGSNIYYSLQDNNTNHNPLADDGWWNRQDGANVDLSNLSATGEKHFLNKNQITNCALETPHRVNYTCSDGTLTIKAGSVLIVPYGNTDRSSTYPAGSTFLNANFKVIDTQYYAQTGGISPNANTFFVWVEVQNDIALTQNGSALGTKRNVYVRMSNNTAIAVEEHTSSNSALLSGSKMCYRTDTNIMELYSNGSMASSTYCLPICVCVDDGTKATASVDCVYDGIYKIGGTIFADKGIKALSANGLNSDGTINNGSIETSLLILATTMSTGDFKSFLRLQTGTALTRIYIVNPSAYLGELEVEPELNSSAFQYYFNKTQMIWYMHQANETSWTPSALYYNFADTIGFGADVYDNFNINKAFRAVDENKIRNAKWVVDSYTNGTSWYRVYSDGFCIQGSKYHVTSTGEFTVTLLKSYKNATYQAFKNYSSGASTTLADDEGSIYATTASSFMTYQNVNDSYYFDWIAFGYIY